MAKSKQTTQKMNNKDVKEVRSMANRKYYSAFPSYDEDTKKIKGLVMDIEGIRYYIDLRDPVITEMKKGDKVLFTRKTYNVSILPAQKKSKSTKNAL